jgi:hypothetical protein
MADSRLKPESHRTNGKESLSKKKRSRTRKDSAELDKEVCAEIKYKISDPT